MKVSQIDDDMSLVIWHVKRPGAYVTRSMSATLGSNNSGSYIRVSVCIFFLSKFSSSSIKYRDGLTVGSNWFSFLSSFV